MTNHFASRILAFGKHRSSSTQARGRKTVPIYVVTPLYNPLSGGVRAMHLLARKLIELGYDAYATPQVPPGHLPPVDMRYLGYGTRASHHVTNASLIAVYPEIVVGNPLDAPVVVRYLLNRSGLLAPGADVAYEAADIFLTFDPDHLPPGRTGVDLFMPLVDRRIYYPPRAPAERHGTIVFTNRQNSEAVADALPPWLSPVTIVSKASPRSPNALADLYRSARCMVVGERSTAIYEALCCGCPVICMPSGVFQEATYQRRFEGAGLSWAPTRGGLERAAATLPRFTALYDQLEASIDHRIGDAFDPIVRRAATSATRWGGLARFVKQVRRRAGSNRQRSTSAQPG